VTGTGRGCTLIYFNENADKKAGFDYTWGTKTGSIRWKQLSAADVRRFWMTGSTFSSDFAFDQSVNFSEENFISDLTLKVILNIITPNSSLPASVLKHKNLHGIYRENFDAVKLT